MKIFFALVVVIAAGFLVNVNASNVAACPGDGSGCTNKLSVAACPGCTNKLTLNLAACPGCTNKLNLDLASCPGCTNKFTPKLVYVEGRLGNFDIDGIDGDREF